MLSMGVCVQRTVFCNTSSLLLPTLSMHLEYYGAEHEGKPLLSSRMQWRSSYEAVRLQWIEAS